MQCLHCPASWRAEIKMQETGHLDKDSIILLSLPLISELFSRWFSFNVSQISSSDIKISRSPRVLCLCCCLNKYLKLEIEVEIKPSHKFCSSPLCPHSGYWDGEIIGRLLSHQNLIGQVTVLRGTEEKC